MNEETIISKANKSIIFVAIIALIAITIVCSVALITMCIQSNTATRNGVEAFRIYMESDYDYPSVSQTQDVKVGEIE